MKEEAVRKILEKCRRAREEIHRKIIGLDGHITLLFVTLLAKGHILIEGEPGEGKSLLASAFLEIFNLDASRIQMTADIMPEDIRFAYNLLQEGGTELKNLKVDRGSLFAQLILIDEINRAQPKTQSVLLEPMEEGTISYERKTIKMKQPYMVIATANPVETSTGGVFELPPAACDRFMLKDLYPYPNIELLKKIYVRDRRHLSLEKIFMSGDEILEAQNFVTEFRLRYDEHHYIIEYIARLINCIRQSGLIRHDEEKGSGYGPTPRAGEDLLDAAAAYVVLHWQERQIKHVTFDDVLQLVYPTVRFKFVFDPRKRAEARELGINSNDDLIRIAIANTPIPIGLKKVKAVRP
ncbi:MAG: AAA family ATPase [Candidatus Yanofskybacteria bacterium]|nr:AAA family ATPase [Candidatus Yanofskybacteria bacterium]